MFDCTENWASAFAGLDGTVQVASRFVQFDTYGTFGPQLLVVLPGLVRVKPSLTIMSSSVADGAICVPDLLKTASSSVDPCRYWTRDWSAPVWDSMPLMVSSMFD